LFLSPLFFPTKPYHALLKDDTLQSDSINNTSYGSCKARDLFYAEIASFSQIDEALKQILYLLLHDKKEFQAFSVMYSGFNGNVCLNTNG
jgi:ATP-dependent DNA helicase RecQ